MKDAAALGEIVAALGGELIGAAELPVSRVGPLQGASPATIAFLANPRYLGQLEGSAAGCVIVAPALRAQAAARGAAIVTPDPYLYFARLTQWWAARIRPPVPPGIHASAIVDSQALLGEGVSIGALAVVEAGARIGTGAVIGAHCFIGRNAGVGEATTLHARVTLQAGCRIGARGIVHSGAVIGADGFGFAPSAEGYVKIEQLGAVVIGDDVEIGANTCIDRGALDDTVIEDGVKLDNLIQIAHNVHIGRGSAMAGCSAVAGSTRIGARCTIGGGAGILGHLSLADDVHISAQSTVSRSITRPGTYTGFFPLDDNRAWEKNAVTLRQLHALRDRIRALEGRSPSPDAPAGGSDDEREGGRPMPGPQQEP